MASLKRPYSAPALFRPRTARLSTALATVLTLSATSLLHAQAPSAPPVQPAPTQATDQTPATLPSTGPDAGPETASDLPPLAAPDWLSDAVTRPHANIATDASVPEITVQPLGAAPPLDATGLLPTSITGLPPDLWGQSQSEALARLFRALPTQGLPAMQSFTESLALSELDPPLDADDSDGALFLARIDMLLDRGALDAAQALIERAGPRNAQVFRRWFDVSLLTGHADRACAAMQASPDIAPTLPARIFCLARSGDWPAAALTLDTGEALGRISANEARLIAQFLDPELFEGEPDLAPDPAPTPLTFQMRVALGQRPDTTDLPLAFAHADLSEIAGWRAQLDASERLTRAGAIEPTQWLDIYTARVPSASGGVWDRVAAVQAFDTAMLARNDAAISARLAPAWAAVEAAGLEGAFAEIYAERLLETPLDPTAAALARRIGLLSSVYEQIAQSATPQTPIEALAFAVARGLPGPLPPRASLTERAVAAAFSDTPPPHRYDWLVRNARLGEAILRAARVLAEQSQDPGDVTDALSFLRSIGLEDVARRAALQLLLTRG